MPPTKRIVKDKRTRIKEIQDAARDVFFDKGYLAATMGEIAKRASVARGTPYLYFKNKDDLYISLMYPTVKDLFKRLKQFEAEMDHLNLKSGSEVIRKMFNIFYEWYLNDPDGFAVSTAFQQGGFFARMSKETLESLNDVGREGFGCMRRIISNAKGKGLIKKRINEAIIADFLYAAFLGLVQFEENKKRVGKKDHMFKTLDYAFSIIANGISSDVRKKNK